MCEQTYTTARVQPTGLLRWRIKQPLQAPILQQEWETITFFMHKPHDRTTEWRDVPLVAES